jgi:hypothetical protein
MTLIAPGFIEQRFHLDARLDWIGFQENKEARFKLCGAKPHVMLSVIPGSVDFDVHVTSLDHFAAERGLDTIVALAVVAQGTLVETVTQLYFSYFPQAFPLKIFGEEAEARSWLMDRRSDLVMV